LITIINYYDEVRNTTDVNETILTTKKSYSNPSLNNRYM